MINTSSNILSVEKRYNNLQIIPTKQQKQSNSENLETLFLMAIERSQNAANKLVLLNRTINYSKFSLFALSVFQ